MKRSAYWMLGLAVLVGCQPSGGDGDPQRDGATNDAMAEAEMGPIEGDMSTPEADQGPPETDQAPPEADMAPPEADQGPPEADMAPPEADMAPPEVDAEPMPPVDEPVGECGQMADDKRVNGWLYVDEDGSDQSPYAGGYDPEVDTARPEGAVLIVGHDGQKAADVCDDGSYVSPELMPGTYLVMPDVPEGMRCSQRNCTGRFARAIAEDGGAVMLTFGDSIAVIGDPVLFPERVTTLFAPLAEIENRNIAVAGTTSTDWLPGGQLFENRLRPQLAEADVILITIGGNDLMAYVSNPALLQNIPAAIEGARDLVVEIVANVITIIHAIREVNPDADIAYLLYADYSQATENVLWGLAGNLLGQQTISEILELARSLIPTDDAHLLLADMYGAADGLPLHDYLFDALHFNDMGQTIYAEEVFRTLGGVYIGDSPLSHGVAPLGLRRSYGVIAVDAE
ncbi:MAG: hypothetical protein KC620_02365 [Myxococcales bacterium]|nr:hypothetical protein [Myxococcales bacterium]